MSRWIADTGVGRRLFASVLGTAGFAPTVRAAGPRPTAADQGGGTQPTVRLFDQLASGLARRSGNIAFSPLSLADALLPIIDGARGATARDLPAAAAAIRAQAAPLMSSTAPLLRCAALWLSPPAQAAPGQPADIKVLPRDPGEAVRAINAWANEGTRGRIPQLIDRLPAQAALIATSALFFGSAWRNQFRPEDTQPGPFRRATGGTAHIRFMHATMAARYARRERLHAVALPYADARYELQILAPAPGAPSGEVLSLVRRGAALAALDLLTGAEEISVGITLPPFSLRDGADLAPMLRNSDAAPLFAANTDLSGIVVGSGRLSAVVQRTVLRVDETGTEAAAVTAAGMDRSLEPTPPRFAADAPFVAAVRAKAASGTGALIAVAVIVDPSTSQA